MNLKRNGIILCFLDLITFGLFFVFYFPHITNEVRTFSKKKIYSYPLMYLLGIITLFIPTMIWFAYVGEIIDDHAYELGLIKKKWGFWRYFLLSGILIVTQIAPFFSTYRFFKNLNLIKEHSNEDMR